MLIRPGKQRKRCKRRKRRIFSRLPGQRVGASLALGGLLALIPPGPAAAAPQTSVTPDLNDLRVRFQTEATEIKIGRRASRRFERRISLVEDVAVHEYVDRIAQNLASNSDVTVPVTIKVVDATEVNAVSFPGGFLYISSGLILAVDDEAEIAGVLAHEIAHVVARDGLRNNRYVGMDFGAEPIILESPNGTVTNVFEDNRTTPITSPRTRREFEADERAMQYMKKAGYDPKSLLAFLEKLQAEETIERREVLPIFQTHPAPAERIRLVQERMGAEEVANTPPDGARDVIVAIKARLVPRATNPARPE